MNYSITFKTISIEIFIYLLLALGVVSSLNIAVVSAKHDDSLSTVDNIMLVPEYKMQDYDKELRELYKNISVKDLSFEQRINFFSKSFLGKPYLLGALGEGTHGKFDKDPLYRTDGFDCVTLVSTVLALAMADNLQQFKHKIAQIRYKDGKAIYRKRNHFTSIDWNINNAKHGIIEDITAQIHDAKRQSIAVMATAYIDKQNWYHNKTFANIKLFKQPTEPQRIKLLQQLREQSNWVENVESKLLYIPLSALYDKHGQPNYALFNQIPSATIIEIVRPNWNLSHLIGTNLNVSHLGFGLRNEQNVLFYRQASSQAKQVVDVPLVKYLQNYLNSPTIKGINIQQIKQ